MAIFTKDQKYPNLFRFSLCLLIKSKLGKYSSRVLQLITAFLHSNNHFPLRTFFNPTCLGTIIPDEYALRKCRLPTSIISGTRHQFPRSYEGLISIWSKWTILPPQKKMCPYGQ